MCNFDHDANLLPVGDVEALLRAAPQLRVFDADVYCGSVADARRVLTANEGLLAPLRVHGLRVRDRGASQADVLALAAEVASHAWLQELCLAVPQQTPAALDAVVDAALARRLTALNFWSSGLSPASAPALARLLGGRDIKDLLVLGNAAAAPLLDAPAAASLAGALRANTTLTTLTLHNVRLWDDAAAAASTLLGALTAHPSLRSLSVSCNVVQEADRAAVGASLGALLAANAPALTELDVTWCGLRDAGMAPLCEALPRNTHLRTLKCAHNGMSVASSRDVLLPAVRANASLRALPALWQWPAEVEAEAIVNGRAAAP